MKSPQRIAPGHHLAITRSRHRSLLRGIGLALGLSLVAGCARSPSLTAEIITPSSEPTTLDISVLSTQSNAEQERMIAPLDAHLEKVLGQPVDFLIADSYQSMIPQQICKFYLNF